MYISGERVTAFTFRRLFLGVRFWALIVIIIISGWRAIISYDDAISIYLSVSLKSQHDGIAALYYDVGEGYSENHVIPVSIKGDNQVHDYLYKMPGKTIYHLRWDPPNTAHDTITISKIEILDSYRRQVERLNLRQLQPLNQIQAFDVTGEKVDVRVLGGADDPQINISLNSPIVVEKLNPLIRFLSGVLVEFMLLFFGACLLINIWFRWRDKAIIFMKMDFFKKTDSLTSQKYHGTFFFLLLIIITIIHFSIPLVATWDTAHYHNYLDILYGKKSWENWDVIRGPVFPVFIAGVHSLFGYSHIGMLFGTYIVTVAVLLIAVYFIRELSRTVSIFISYSLLFVFLFLNPIFLGYYHTVLTEFMASFLMIFSVLISYLWFHKNVYDNTKFEFIGLSIILIVLVSVSFHLKQPYVATTIMPLLGSSLLSILFDRKIINIIQRLLVVVISIILLICSLIVWHNFLPNKGIASYKVRTSYYMVSEHLYRGLFSQTKTNTDQLIKNEQIKKESIKQDVIVGGISLAKLSYADVENDKTINFFDSGRALKLKRTGKEESYSFLFIADSDGKIIDKILIGGKPGIMRSVFELIRICIAHPVLSLKKFVINFMEITRLMENPWRETEIIAFKSFEAKGYGNNVFLVAYYFEPLIAPYKHNEINFIGSIPYKLFKKLSLWMFPILLNILSSLWILFVLYFLFNAFRSRITKKDLKIRNSKIIIFLFISSFAIFSQIFFPNVLLGYTNDRYVFPAYFLSLIVWVIILLQLIALIKERLSRKSHA
jgi:hypothetical protein